MLVDAVGADGNALELVLRHDSGDGPLSGTDIDLAHEAIVYRALADHPVRIPRLLAEAEDGRTLLVERARGGEAFAAVEPAAARAAVADDFAVALAELHNVDPTKLELGGAEMPRVAANYALIDLKRWLAIRDARVEEPGELSRLAADWLLANPPAEVERGALCHGDAGAGNFLFEKEQVTAILDWEFAHLGDPLDDIAWVLVRSHLLGGGHEMKAALPVWSAHAGLPLVAERIRYYRAMVLLRMAISCQVALGHAQKGGAMDTTTYEMLLPYLDFLLPQALQEAGCRDAGVDRIGQETEASIQAHPILKNAAKALDPWETT